ncbi:MAG: CpaF family protein, partial [Acidimicrobiales bacterium]|nr:CpaF family protein [Acidimicrobiales bacterium]
MRSARRCRAPSRSIQRWPAPWTPGCCSPVCLPRCVGRWAMAEHRSVAIERAVAALDDLVPLPDEDELRRRVVEAVAAAAPLLDESGRASAVEAVVARLRGLGPLDALLDAPEVTDVLVNGDGSVWTERSGVMTREAIELTADERAAIIERIVHPLGLRADRAHPIVDARLADGSRANAVLPPVSVDGPCLSIRRFGAAVLPLEAFCPSPVADLLHRAVRARCNIVVSGGTGSGKTTLLNALAAHIPAGERLVTIEDAAELRLGRAHVVRLEARPANAEGVGAVAIRDLVRAALRMRPDRILVGEARGPEALDMLQAMNTGHEGSMTTLHANTPRDAVARMETMIMMAGFELPIKAMRQQIASAVDLIIQANRLQGGKRRITHITEVVGM